MYKRSRSRRSRRFYCTCVHTPKRGVYKLGNMIKYVRAFSRRRIYISRGILTLARVVKTIKLRINKMKNAREDFLRARVCVCVNTYAFIIVENCGPYFV